MSRDYEELSIFGGEARLFLALAFIPDPERPVKAMSLCGLLDRSISEVLKSGNQLAEQGMLIASDNPKEFKRVDSPLWAIFETAKVVFADMGIDCPSIKK
jgi:hypothetical protein